MEFIPGTENNLEKKKFTWSLAELNEERLDFELIFEHPEYISIEKTSKLCMFSFVF